MLSKHARIVDALPPEVVDYLEWYFDCTRDHDELMHLSWALARCGASQADVVLALLRRNSALHTRCAEALVGHGIRRCPPCLRPVAPPALPDDTGLFAQRITFVSRNPRMPTTGAWYRFRIFREGQTVGSFVRRGGRRRDVLHAIRNGWIRVENFGAYR